MKTIYKIHEVETGDLVFRTECENEAKSKFEALEKGYELSVCQEVKGQSLGSTLIDFK